MLEFPIVCHNFLCLYQPNPIRIQLMETRDMPKELRLFYAILKTFPFYVRCYQFITVQVTLEISSHQLNLNLMLYFKMLCVIILNIVILRTLNIFPGGHHIGPIKIWTILRLSLSNPILTKIQIMMSPKYLVSHNKVFPNFSRTLWFCGPSIYFLEVTI